MSPRSLTASRRSFSMLLTAPLVMLGLSACGSLPTSPVRAAVSPSLSSSSGAPRLRGADPGAPAAPKATCPSALPAGSRYGAPLGSGLRRNDESGRGGYYADGSRSPANTR